MNRLIMGTLLLAWCTGMSAGCATTEQKASPQHKPLVNSAGSNGVLFLSMNGSQWSEPRATRSSRITPGQTPVTAKTRRKRIAPREINLVKVKNDSGRTIGKFVMPIDTGEMIIDGLRQELSAAGYTVKLVRKLPKDVERGVAISLISTDLEQKSELLTLEGKCHLHIKVDMWRNGSRVATHNYASNVSENSFSDQHLHFAELMMKVTQNVISQAVPGIINDVSALSK